MRRHHDALVGLAAVHGQVLHEVAHVRLPQQRRGTHDDLPHRVDAHGNRLVRASLRDEVVGDGLDHRQQVLGRHQLVAGLDQVRQDLRHILLVGGQVALQKTVVAEEQQLVAADEAGDEVHQQKLDFESLAARLPQLLEQLLRQGLGIVQHLNGGEERSGIDASLLVLSPELGVMLDLLLHVAGALFGLLAVRVVVHLSGVLRGGLLLFLVLVHLCLDAQEEINRGDHHAS